MSRQRLGKVVFAPRLFQSRRLTVVNIKIHETLCDILLCAACKPLYRHARNHLRALASHHRSFCGSVATRTLLVVLLIIRCGSRRLLCLPWLVPSASAAPSTLLPDARSLEYRAD